MATGGFKAAEWIFSVTTAPTGTAGATKMANDVKWIIKNVCNLIIQCEPHWTHDPEYTATEDDFVRIGTNTSRNYQEYAHFLINTVTGSRLLVCYLLGLNAQVNAAVCCQSRYTSNGSRFAVGLCFSMLPGGSSSSWNISSACTTSAFIPNDATLLLGPCNKIYSSNTDESILGYYNGETTRSNYRYVVIAKEDLIFVALGSVGNVDLKNAMCVGKIFGQLCNQEDNQYYSKYGAFLFNTDADTLIRETVANNATATAAFWLNTRSNNVFWNANLAGCYFRSSIITRPVTYVSSQSRPQMTGTNPMVSSGDRTSSITSGKTAFGAFMMSHSSDDANSYGVVPGNCFKGYLDTDFFRYVYYGFQYDTLFDGGNFIYAGGAIALGWDPSNTITLRG